MPLKTRVFSPGIPLTLVVPVIFQLGTFNRWTAPVAAVTAAALSSLLWAEPSRADIFPSFQAGKAGRGERIRIRVQAAHPESPDLNLVRYELCRSGDSSRCLAELYFIQKRFRERIEGTSLRLGGIAVESFTNTFEVRIARALARAEAEETYLKVLAQLHQDAVRLFRLRPSG